MPKKAKKAKVVIPARKQCPRCKATKDTKTGFYPDKQNKTGYRTYCKECLKKPKKPAKSAAKGKPKKAPKGKAKPKAVAAAVQHTSQSFALGKEE